MKIVSRCSYLVTRVTSDELSFKNFSGGNTAGADINPFNGSLKIDFDPLEIRQETT